MAVLGRRTTARALLFTAVAALAGCLALRRWIAPVRGFAFSHRRHVEVEKLACENCHADALASDAPGMPAPDTCEVCHVEIDAERPPERRVAALFADGSFRALRVSALPSEVVFSHRLHAAGSQDCGDCHAGIGTNERVEELPPVAMDACTGCHAAKSVAREPERGCALCHRKVTEGWPPESHRRNWKRVHGRVARMGAEATADRCELCHSDSTCAACHQVEAPESHTAFWHLRGHGIAAMMDRESCAACHEPVSCERCHAEAIPRNHAGPWGSPTSTHCLVCHQPLKHEGCAACHPAATSHLLAPPLPTDPDSFHTPTLNCRQCHVPGPLLHHVDNGDDCTSCHL